MMINPKTAEGDLAFMRELVEEGHFDSYGIGINYLAAGLLYGSQCLLNGILLVGQIEAPTLVWLAIGILPTALFLTVNISFVWRHRARPFGTGTANRAVQASFAGGGVANLILALVFGAVAHQRGDWSIWFLFPVVVCAFQGAIWFAAAVIRRQVWYGIVAAGWFASTIVLSWVIDQSALYVLILGGVLLLCMAVPGYVSVRQSPQRP